MELFSLANVQNEEVKCRTYMGVDELNVKKRFKSEKVILKFADLKLKPYLCHRLRTG